MEKPINSELFQAKIDLLVYKKALNIMADMMVENHKPGMVSIIWGIRCDTVEEAVKIFKDRAMEQIIKEA